MANWPNEPQAPTMPTARLRFSGGKARATTAITTPNPVQARPKPTSRPGDVERERRGRVRHREQPRTVREPTRGEHAPGAVAVGDRAHERHRAAPHQVLQCDRERESLAPPAEVHHRPQE